MNESNTQLNLKSNDFYSFKSECSCFKHNLKAQFTKDNNEFDSLMFYDQVYINEDFLNDGKSWISHLWKKIKLAYKCLFKDGFQVEHKFCFKSKHHLKEFIQYINNEYLILYKDEKKNNIQSNYIIPKLPFGWSIDNMTIKLLDLTTIDTKNNKLAKLINVKFKDNGAGHFCTLSFINEIGKSVNIDFDCDTIKNIGEFIESIKFMIDDSYDKAINEIK